MNTWYFCIAVFLNPLRSLLILSRAKAKKEEERERKNKIPTFFITSRDVKHAFLRWVDRVKWLRPITRLTTRVSSFSGCTHRPLELYLNIYVYIYNMWNCSSNFSWGTGTMGQWEYGVLLNTVCCDESIIKYCEKNAVMTHSGYMGSWWWTPCLGEACWYDKYNGNSMCSCNLELQATPYALLSCVRQASTLSIGAGGTQPCDRLIWYVE